jgi:hypothetical protein
MASSSGIIVSSPHFDQLPLHPPIPLPTTENAATAAAHPLTIITATSTSRRTIPSTMITAIHIFSSSSSGFDSENPTFDTDEVRSVRLVRLPLAHS